MRFPGQYFDLESNLSYNYFRDYDPAIGRYVESDPIGLEGGVNTYAYTANSPLMYSDPSGESLVLEAPIVIGGGLLIGACIASEGCSQIIRGAIETFIKASSEAATRAEYCRAQCSKELEKNPHRPKDRRLPSDRYTNNFHKCFLKCMAGDECE
jgi:RHS repeat-associated protein